MQIQFSWHRLLLFRHKLEIANAKLQTQFYLFKRSRTIFVLHQFRIAIDNVIVGNVSSLLEVGISNVMPDVRDRNLEDWTKPQLYGLVPYCK